MDSAKETWSMETESFTTPTVSAIKANSKTTCEMGMESFGSTKYRSIEENGKTMNFQVKEKSETSQW